MSSFPTPEILPHFSTWITNYVAPQKSHKDHEFMWQNPYYLSHERKKKKVWFLNKIPEKDGTSLMREKQPPL